VQAEQFLGRCVGSENKQQQQQKQNAGVLRSAQNDKLFKFYSVCEAVMATGDA
jgi:ABC-type branched-subunit amino acid transport system ATPase component